MHGQKGCPKLPCCPILCCPVLFCPVLFKVLSLPSIHPQEKHDWSRVKSVFHTFLTQLHSLFLSAFPLLSLLLSPGSPLWDALPTWLWGRLEEPRGRGNEPAPPGAVLLSCCWGLPARQLVPSAAQSSLRYLAQSL